MPAEHVVDQVGRHFAHPPTAQHEGEKPRPLQERADDRSLGRTRKRPQHASGT
jgi:hypothetical protein